MKGRTPLPGEKFVRLTVIETFLEQAPTQRIRKARCQCDCGNIIVARATALIQGNTGSCGCLQAEHARERTIKRNSTHGMSTHPLYRQYQGMLARCTYPSQPNYKNYGGRGITVCDEWRESFEVFRDWALANGWDGSLTIERKDNDGNYSPENCCFATCTEQANNKSSNRLLTIFGEEKTIAEWTRDQRCQSNYQAIIDRIDKLGWSAEKAVTSPVRHNKRHFS